MRFYNFLRRMNRGIALALVLIIILSCYLVIDNIAFAAERDVIEQVISDYCNEMETFLILPEQYRSIGSTVPLAVIEEMQAHNLEVINKYFYSGIRNGWRLKDMVITNADGALRTNTDAGAKIESFDAELAKVSKIVKHGTSVATIEGVISITVEATENATFFELFFPSYAVYGFTLYNDAPRAQIESEDYDEPYELIITRHTYQIEFNIEMTKVGDSWLFSGYDYFWSNR